MVLPIEPLLFDFYGCHAMFLLCGAPLFDQFKFGGLLFDEVRALFPERVMGMHCKGCEEQKEE